MSEDIAEYISDFDAKLRGTCLKSWDKVHQNYFPDFGNASPKILFEVE